MNMGFTGCERLASPSKFAGFVSGHDFSHAATAAKSSAGFSPCGLFLKLTRCWVLHPSVRRGGFLSQGWEATNPYLIRGVRR
jgi:hypothetical protein